MDSTVQEFDDNFFIWNSDFNTGIPKVDEQNTKFLALLNRVGHFFVSDTSEIEIIAIVDEIIDNALNHFKSEEKYWQSIQFELPEFNAHQEQHLQFIEKVQEFKSQFIISPQKTDIETFFTFLTGWFTTHILESDKRIACIVSSVKEGLDLSEARRCCDKKMQNLAHTITAALLSTNSLRLMHAIKLRNGTLNKLSQSEERLLETVKYAKIGYWELPINSKKAYWSPGMYELFGLPSDSLSGPETLCQLMDKDYHSPFLCSVTKAFETGAEHHVEYPIVRARDGENRWIECRGRIVNNNNGEPEKLIGFIQDITIRKENETRIEQLAYYDSLTQLPNRRLLLERLNKKIIDSKRSLHSNALLFLDLDNFKMLNDIHGHDYGDILLHQAAIRISQSIRIGDTASRVGGDEFVVILERLSIVPIQAAAEVEKIALKILQQLTQAYQIHEIQHSTTCSIGIVLFNDDKLSSSELMKQADIAMYQAKQAGKNTLRFFDPMMQKDIAERAAIEAELHRAIAEHEFELFYQPQCNEVGEVLGAEALIRWNHPTKGLILPQHFISLAEDTGLIVPIGEWVITMACAQLKAWQTQGNTSRLSLSVNVSQKQFQQADFITKIDAIVNEYGVDPSKLKVELTESVLAKDLELTITRMNELGNMGIQLSLDDFGTGYSSLQYLKTLPLSQLKIDYSFVRDLMTDPNDRSIVKTIISMAKGLGLGVIAEGVETQEQKQYLLSEDCTLYQGFLFSKPIPIDKFEKLISNRVVLSG